MGVSSTEAGLLSAESAMMMEKVVRLCGSFGWLLVNKSREAYWRWVEGQLHKGSVYVYVYMRVCRQMHPSQDGNRTRQMDEKVYRFKLNQAHSRGERQEKRGVGGKLYALYCLGNAAVLNGFGVV